MERTGVTGQIAQQKILRIKKNELFRYKCFKRKHAEDSYLRPVSDGVDRNVCRQKKNKTRKNKATYESGRPEFGV